MGGAGLRQELPENQARLSKQRAIVAFKGEISEIAARCVTSRTALAEGARLAGNFTPACYCACLMAARVFLASAWNGFSVWAATPIHLLADGMLSPPTSSLT